MTEISLLVNGEEVVRAVEPRTHLADFLRDGLNLTATHIRCEQGVCGACTILIDGEPARSCITYAMSCQGAAVTTLEGLATDPVVESLRGAFKAEHALQCGFCTPGMLVTARDIVTRLPHADEARVRLELSGNLCRCTGYGGIVRAIMRVLANRRQAEEQVAQAPHSWLGPLGARGHVRTAAIAAPTAFGADEAARADDDEIGLGAASPNLQTEVLLDLANPAEQVWSALCDVQRLALCVPGATLLESSGDGKLRGRVNVKLGPLSTSFVGAGVFVRNEEDRTGRLLGSGQDQISRTRARGEIVFSVESARDGARLRARVEAVLTGPLAQFGRSGLAQEVIRRMAQEFGRRLEVQISGREGSRQEAAFKPASLLTAAIVACLRRALGRLNTRIRKP